VAGWLRGPLAFAIAAGLVALSGCSSTPAYCSDRTNLQNSVKELNVSGGISGLKSQVAQIQSDATALVGSAQGDFPSQTSAITSSVDALKRSVTALPSSASVGQLVTIIKDAASVTSSVRSFMDASNAACS
jgi:hypothetical protein